MAELIQVLTTVEREEEAEGIATELVERRLAACVQIVGPIASTYRWNGEVQSAEEWQCWIKTRRDLYDDVESAIRQLHAYEIPEIIALPIVEGSKDYLAWVEENVGPEG